MEPKATLTAFGLSTDVRATVQLKIEHMDAITDPQLASLADRYRHPDVYKTYSNVAPYLEFFIEVTAYDNHHTHNMLLVPVHTKYSPFNGSLRSWNTTIALPLDYRQLLQDAYLQLRVFEVTNTKPNLFAVGSLSLFNRESFTLRSGRQKVAIYRASNQLDPPVCYQKRLPGLTVEEEDLAKYENGQLPRVPWLDKFVIPKVASSPAEGVGDYSLYVELPSFDLPIVYSEWRKPETTAAVSVARESSQTVAPSTVLNLVTISPDTHHQVIDYTIPGDEDDPIEAKYHRLERNINNALLDKEIKPSPQVRDELLRILVKAASTDLSEYEKNLIWKFRYYFSKNSDTGTALASFLPKFLKSIDWENDSEVDHAFSDIIPRYWTVEKIHIGDALEFLGSYFNPYTLYPTGSAATGVDPVSKNEEEKFQNVVTKVRFIRKFAVDRLKQANSEELLLYLLQLIQALKYEAKIYHGDEQAILNLPLTQFLIERSVEVPKLGNYFYWYLKVENEDMVNQAKLSKTQPPMIYLVILNKFIAELKSYCSGGHKKLPYYAHLKRQIWFVKKLSGLVELMRTTFKRNEATARKVEYLREYLGNSLNEFLKFPETFPLPLDPLVMVCGCYPQELSVFKSSLAPLKITLKTVEISGNTKKYGKYPMMFKIGDDLRQDQLVIQMIDLMDQLLKNENLDLKLTPYKILATLPVAGMMQFVPNETLDEILAQLYPQDDYPVQISSSEVLQPNGILSYLRLHSREDQPVYEPAAKSIWYLPTALTHSPPAALVTGTSSTMHSTSPRISNDLGVLPVLMENYIKLCAGYCVITYILGVGDRHLDNLLLSPNGKFWHADFGYILGRDPKPFPPLMKLPIQVIDGMGGLHHENFGLFKGYCFTTYSTLRKNLSLIINLFELMLDANIPDIKVNRGQAIEKVEEKFRIDLTEEEAIVHFQNLITDSVQAFLPVVIDKLHSLAQYWRA